MGDAFELVFVSRLVLFAEESMAWRIVFEIVDVGVPEELAVDGNLCQKVCVCGAVVLEAAVSDSSAIV